MVSQLEQALVWFERIILVLLLLLAVLSGKAQEGLIFALVLLTHSTVYWTVPRASRWTSAKGRGATVARSLARWSPAALSLVDVLLGGAAFYATGNVTGQAGILGFCLASIMAARFTLWLSLAINAGVWLVFALPLLYNWFWLRPPSGALTVVGSLFIYVALTFILNYLASLEDRQTRNAHLVEQTNRRLQQAHTLYKVERSLATLHVDEVLAGIAEQTVQVLDVDICGVLLYEQDCQRRRWIVLRALHGPTGAATKLLGTRFEEGEGVRLQEEIRGTGYWALGGPETDAGLEPDSQLGQMLAGLGARSSLFVGLSMDEEPRGFLIVAVCRARRSFSAEEVQLCQAVAYQAAVAVENARLCEETDEKLNKRLRELATLEEIDHELSTSLDSTRILNLVLHRALEICNATSGMIGTLSSDGQWLNVHYRYGERPEGAPAVGTTRWSVQDGIVGRTLRSGKAALIPDVTADSNYRLVLPSTRSEIVIPIKREERVIGVLNLESDRHAAFAEDDLHFLEHLADHAGIAIENARLFQAERQRVKTLSAVNDISQEIRASLDLERTLRLVLARVKDLVGYHAAEICLWHEDEQIMVTWASDGDPRYTARAGDVYRLDEGFTGWIARHQQELLIPDIAAWQGVQPRILAGDASLRSYLGLPLKIGQTFIGTLELASDQINAYGEEDAELLQIIAGQAAVAIQSARLYEETQHRFEQTQLLLRVTETIGSSLELTDTVRHVAREMCRALEADMAGVYLADELGTRLQPVAGYHVPKERLEQYQALEIPISGHRFIEEARETRRAVYSLDPGNDPRIDRETANVFPNQTTLFAPMIARDEFIGGVYLVWMKEKRGFNGDELQMANAIAWQAGTVVDNARLFEAQQRRVSELSILFETSAAVSSSLALDEVLNTVARQVARALNVSACSISDWDPERGTVTTLVHQDLIPGPPAGDVGVSYSLADYPATAQVLRERRPHVVHVSGLEADPAEVELLEELGQKSLLMIPLVTRDSVVGLLELFESRHSRDFSAADVRLGQALASQAAVAIENARLYEQTDERLRARLDQLTALQRTTQELNATLALDRILEVVLEAAIRTCAATHGNVLLVDVDTGELTLWTAQGYSDAERATIQRSLRQPMGDSIIRRAVESGQPQILTDATLEADWVWVRNDTRSALVVPIYYEQRVVGVINLRHTDLEAFDQEDVAFIQSLAEQAAIAIGNALRYEDQIKANTTLRERTEQIGKLLEVGRKLRADVPLEDTLEEIAYAIQETVGFGQVLISISEGTPRVLRRVAAAGLPLSVFEEMKKVRQPLERYERVLREEYRQGLCYFFPFDKREDWQAELHTHTSLAIPEEWREGQWHPNDMLLAPLRGAGGRLLGYISVDEPRDGLRPSRQTLEALTIFANQAAIAIENSNLYEDAQRRADNLALINQLSQALTQVLEPTEVLETVVKAIGLLLGCELASVFQLDASDGKFAAVSSIGLATAQLTDLRFAPGEGLVGNVAVTRHRLLVPDTEREPLFVEGPVPVGSMLCVPMVAGNQVVGVLTAGNAHKYTMTESDLVLLTTLADQAAVALESARLFASAQQTAVQLSLLNAIGRQSAAQLELREMLDSTVNALHHSLGYYRVAVLLVDEGSQELSFAAANRDFWPVIPPRYRQQIGEGLIGAAATTGKSVLANDAQADARFMPLGDLTTPASLSVPIRIADKVIGVLHVEADRRWAFREQDVAALEIAADQLAVAVENARLFQETERRVAELATINEIGRAISGALDEEQLSELIYTQVSKLLDTRNFLVALREPATDRIHIRFLVEEGFRRPSVWLEAGQGLTSYLIRTGRPILLAHGVEEFSRQHNLTLEQDPARSWLGVPMVAEDRVIGAVAVQSFHKENAFDRGHLNLLATVAGQAAVAFQNAFLFEERERRIAELSVLNEMAQAISSSLKLDDLLETVHQQVGRIFDTTNFYIATYQEGGETWTLALAIEHGERQPLARYSIAAGLTGHIIRSRNSVLLKSLRENIAFHEQQGLQFVGEQAHSWMGVPLIAADQVVGIMAIQSYEQENLYDDQDLSLFSTIAAETAAAVRNAQLYQQIVHFSAELEDRVEARTHDLEKALSELTLERDRVETLYRITSELGTTLELERVLQRALHLFADSLQVTHGTISLLDQETHYLHLRASLEPVEQGGNDGMGKASQEMGAMQVGYPTPLRSGVGLAGWVIDHREPVLIADITQDPRWIEISGTNPDIRSVVAAPLSLGGGDILGVLTLGHPQIDYFDKEHLKLVTAAAAQIAIAVNNSDLYAFITDQADQLGTMLLSQQAEAAKNQAVLESIADGVLVLDHNGRVLLINPAAEQMLGISAKALEGHHFRYMLGMGATATQRELAQGLYSELRRRLESPGGADTVVQRSTVRFESGKLALAVNIAPLITSVGGAPGVVAALRDISREVEVERLKDEFISTVSHELRTPMTSIKGYTDLLFLGMAGGLSDAQRSFLQIIKSNADRLTALVNDILDISRIETGRIRLTIEALNLEDIISDVIVAFREQYREKGIALEWQQLGGLPKVRGDKDRKRMALHPCWRPCYRLDQVRGRVRAGRRCGHGHWYLRGEYRSHL
jgi:PAS domain S-box-containing protein